MAETNININFTKSTGKMKPMHGWNCAPCIGGEPAVNTSLFDYMREASIPYSRLHDIGFFNPHMVDIPGIYPNFDADENDPDSYDFTLTDVLLNALADFGTEPFYRLGITIENAANIKAYHVFPPKSFAKWQEYQSILSSIITRVGLTVIISGSSIGSYGLSPT